MLIGKITVTILIGLFALLSFIGFFGEKKLDHKPHWLAGFVFSTGLIIWLWFK